MYLENGSINQIFFNEKVQTCLPFNKEKANETLGVLKSINSHVTFLINEILIQVYESNIFRI